MNVRCKGGPWAGKTVGWIAEADTIYLPDHDGEYRRMGVRAYWCSHSPKLKTAIAIELVVYAAVIYGTTHL